MSTGKTFSTKYILDSNNNKGAEGQVLSSTTSGIDWVDLTDIPALGDYLPLAGGTLTGALSGTSATFSGKIIAPKLSIQNQINTTSSNLEINYENGDGTTTAFKDFYVRDGKNAAILTIQGSSKDATFAGDVTGVTFRADNNESYYAKDKDGTSRRLIRYGTDNNVYIGNEIGELYFSDTVGTQKVYHEGNLTISGTNTGDQDLSGYLLNTTDTFTGNLSIANSSFTGLSLTRDSVNGSSIDFNNSNGLLGRAGFLSNGTFAITNDTVGTYNMLSIELDGDATFAGTVLATNLSGTNTGDQTLPTASSLGAVTITGTQTISGDKTFSNASNHYNGHLYYDAYDDAGNHYPHFSDGSTGDGTTINWRQYYGTTYKTHTWASDASGNMAFTFQGDIDANGGDISADNFSGSSSGTNTGDQDLSGYLPLAGGTMTGNITIDQGAVAGNPRLTFDHDNFGTSAYYIEANRNSDWLNFVANGGSRLTLSSTAATFAGTVSATNLSGTNTGDQDLSTYALLTDITGTNSGTNTGDQDLSGYLPLAGGTMTGQLEISGTSPQMKFTDTSSTSDDFWIHINSNNFFILTDRDDDGTYESAHPLQLEADTNKAYTFGNEIYTTDNLPTIPSGNSIIDWTADQGATNIHANNVTGYLKDTTDTLTGTLTIASAAVPLIFEETGYTGQGKYWRQVVDGGNLRFDSCTTGDGLFTPYNSFSVSKSGDATASNLSGTNTGDQDLSGYLLNTTDTLTGSLTVTGQVITPHITLSGNLYSRISDASLALQRMDTRTDATNYSRSHWYGIKDDGATSNFRHAWYDGSNYIDVTASSGTATFGGNLAANNVSGTNTGDQDLSGYALTSAIPSGNSIIDWTADQGATNIHSGNYTNTTYDSTDFVDLTTAQTVGGIKTFTSDMVIKNGDPTLGFADTDANNDDFYIHVNSNNFYVLADRDDSGLNEGITGWDGAHPLQLESDTNKAYTFGNEIYTTDNLPTIPSGNAIIDWTTDQGATNIHANNVTGYLKDTTDTLSGNLSISGGNIDIFRSAGNHATTRAETLSRAGLVVKSSGSFDSKLTFSSGASSVQYIQALNNASTVGRDIHINPYGGNVISAGTFTGTNFILSSDSRLKENVEEVDNKSINVDWKTFEMKSNKGQKRYGVIAQELEEVHPEFVRTNDEGMKSVAYVDLLIAKIAELEARLAKVENK